MKTKYVDLKGLQIFADELKSWLKNYKIGDIQIEPIKQDIKELKEAIDALSQFDFNEDFNIDFWA